MKSVGGYVNVDFTGYDLSTTSPQTIPGVFQRTKSAFETGKSVFFVNMMRPDHVGASPVPVYVIDINDTQLRAMAAEKRFTIRSTDVVDYVDGWNPKT